MKNNKMALSILNRVLGVLTMVLILFMTLKAGEAAYALGYRIFTESPVDKAPGKDITVRFREGMSASELGSLLEDKGLVDSGVLFALQLRLSSLENKLKSGTYTLNTSQTAEEMIQILAGEETEEAEE